jgi:hypothetical protein
MFGLTTTRRLRAELTAAKAETDRQRERAEKAIEAKETAETNRAQVLRQNADQDTANRRLHDRNLELGRRISRLTEADPEYATALEQRVARLKKVAGRLAAAVVAERQRASSVQKQMDTFLGLDAAAIADGATWQDRRQTRMRFDKPTGKEVTS